MLILGLDPSGEFTKGKGKSGYAIFDTVSKQFKEVGYIDASTSQSFIAHCTLHETLFHSVDLIVCENFRLRADKSLALTGSLLETPKLIGVLEFIAHKQGKKLVFQEPSQKVACDDERLEKLQHLKRDKQRFYLNGAGAGVMTNDHMRDAMRHVIIYCMKNKLL